jgi:basic amino acid/polyamine antiporter, APA family
MSVDNKVIKAKKMGFWMLIALVTGNMIGSGVFLLPASLAALGTISLTSWILTALGAMLLAWVFARMSVLVSAPGGPYAYAQAGFGKFIGFQMAFYYWFALWVGNAAIAIAMASYLHVLFPALEQSSVRTFLAIIIVWVLTFINCLGVRQAGVIQVISTLLKLIPILLIAIFGWFYFKSANLTSSPNLTSGSDLSVFTAGVSLTLWAFIGVESATVPSDCVKNPKKNIPLATMFGTLLAAIVYILSSIAIAGMIPDKILAQSFSPFADAAAIIFGPWGKIFIGIGAVISCFGALNGWTLLVGQVGKSAANRGFFPKFMAKGYKDDTPVVGLIVSAILITLLLLATLNYGLVKQFNTIILIAVIGSLVPYLFTCISVLIVSKRKLGKINPFELLAAIGAVIYVVWAIFGVGVIIIFYSMILFVVSVILYFFAKNKS